MVATNWGPPSINDGINRLVNLPEAYASGQNIGAQMGTRRGLQGGVPRTPDGSIDFAAMADIAARAGDIETAQNFARSAANAGNQALDQQYKMGMLKLAQNRASEEPANIRAVRAAGMDPSSPEGRKALFPRTDTPISATDKKAIFEAEDAVPQIRGTIEALNRAIDLNDNTFSGAGAGARAWMGSNLPDMLVPDAVADPKTANATTEWQKIMGPEALQQMANTLKGATTDYELRQFIDMLGNPSTPPNIRKSILQRMRNLADRKLQLNEARIKDLRGGDYFKPGNTPVPQAGQVMTKQQYDALPPGTPYTAPDGSQRVKR